VPKVEIKTTEPEGQLARGLLDQFNALIDRVRRRAYELFEQRGREDGSDVQDWLRAEEELLFPATFKVEKKPDSYNLYMSIPGFKGKDLKVYALGDSLIVKGDVRSKNSNDPAESIEESRGIFYQWPVPPVAHMNSVTAEFKQDTLTIKIPIEARPKEAQIKSGPACTAA
jgi:HSP20 family molecular chaperone IbpA